MPNQENAMPDLAQAERYLSILDEEAEGFCFQTFDDLKSRKNKALASIRQGSFEQWSGFLVQMNGSGAGVFVTVNESDGRGRKLENITRIRAIWHEEDVPCGKDFPLEPHLLIESSPGKFHRYWLVDGLSQSDFSGVMMRMIKDYGSDPNVKDTARVLRVPGFFHQKDPANPFMVRIVAESGGLPYSAAAILQAFPPLLNAQVIQMPTAVDGRNDGAAKALVAELASRASRRTHEDPTKGRHTQVLWLGFECAKQGIAIEYAEYAINVFSRLMRQTDTTGQLVQINFESEVLAFKKSYAKGLAHKPATGQYVMTGTPEGSLVICQDAPSGAIIHEATGYAVAVIESAAEWFAAVKVLRKEFPALRFIFADYYQAMDKVIPSSPCRAASETVGGVVIEPLFNQGEIEANARSFYDLHRSRGIDAVRNAFNGSLGLASPPKMATDRKELAAVIDASDDFDELTGPLLAQVLSSGLPIPAREHLLSRIAKKAGVPKSSLLANGTGDGNKGSNNDRMTDESDGRIDELNDKHAVLPIGGRILVMNRDYDPVMERQLLTFSAKSDFETRYCNRKVFYKGEEVGLGSYWINHPRRREYDGMVFSPGQDQPGYLNLWSGWGVEPKPGSCKKYLAFVHDVICSGDAALFNYIIYWCAHLVQRPHELPETALVFRGREGIGKDTFVRPLRDIVSSEHFLMLSSLNQITGRFSGHLSNALLVFCNESVWGGDKSAQGVLKSMITDEVQPIEHKGRDLFMVKSYRRMIFATNENWAVPRGADDRRYVITDVSDSRKGDYDYFKAIREEMKNGGTAALMAYLLSVDINDWHPRQIPESLQACGWELKIRSGGSIVQWWYDMLLQGWITKIDAHYTEEDELIWPEQCLTSVIQSSYLKWCMDYKITHPEHSVVIGHQIKDWGINTARPRKDNPHRKLFYLLPSLEQAQAIFSARFSIPPDVWEVH